MSEASNVSILPQNTAKCLDWHSCVKIDNTAQYFWYFLIFMFFFKKEQNIMNKVAVYKNSSLLDPV